MAAAVWEAELADAKLVHHLVDTGRTRIAHALLPAPELGAAGAPVEPSSLKA